MTVCFTQIYKPDQDERFNLPVTMLWTALVMSICAKGRSFLSCLRHRITIPLVSCLFEPLFSEIYLQKSRNRVETSAEHFPPYLYEVHNERRRISVRGRDIDELEDGVGTDAVEITTSRSPFCLATTFFCVFYHLCR